MQTLFFTYFAIINLVAFGMFGWDKYKAKKAKRRISESDLFMVTALGGFVGSIAGMNYFRHKTVKSKFLRRFWLVVGVRLAFIIGILFWM